MKNLNEAGKTIILISHDMGVVAEYASRTIVMKDGGILMEAGTREVFTRADILGEASIEPHLLTKYEQEAARPPQPNTSSDGARKRARQCGRRPLVVVGAAGVSDGF